MKLALIIPSGAPLPMGLTQRLYDTLVTARAWYEHNAGVTFPISFPYVIQSDRLYDVPADIFQVADHDPAVGTARPVFCVVAGRPGGGGAFAYAHSSGLAVVPEGMLTPGVVTHELAHVFGALDQYETPTVPNETPSPFDDPWNLLDDEGAGIWPNVALSDADKALIRRSPWVTAAAPDAEMPPSAAHTDAAIAWLRASPPLNVIQAEMVRALAVGDYDGVVGLLNIVRMALGGTPYEAAIP